MSKRLITRPARKLGPNWAFNIPDARFRTAVPLIVLDAYPRPNKEIVDSDHRFSRTQIQHFEGALVKRLTKDDQARLAMIAKGAVRAQSVLGRGPSLVEIKKRLEKIHELAMKNLTAYRTLRAACTTTGINRAGRIEAASVVNRLLASKTAYLQAEQEDNIQLLVDSVTGHLSRIKPALKSGRPQRYFEHELTYVSLFEFVERLSLSTSLPSGEFKGSHGQKRATPFFAFVLAFNSHLPEFTRALLNKTKIERDEVDELVKIITRYNVSSDRLVDRLRKSKKLMRSLQASRIRDQ